MNHRVKTISRFFQDCKRGLKTFELRQDDRNYQVGDVLIQEEWDGKFYTGEQIRHLITYKFSFEDMPKWGLREGWCILGIEPVSYTVQNWRCDNCDASADVPMEIKFMPDQIKYLCEKYDWGVYQGAVICGGCKGKVVRWSK